MLVLVVIFVLILLYAWYIEPNRLQVSHQKVTASKQKSGSLRILFLSDLHIGYFTRSFFLRRKLARLLALHQQEPVDLIMLGGDFIDRNPRYLDLLGQFLAQFAAFKVPVLAVLGNHDYKSFANEVAPLLSLFAAHEIQVLRNQSTVVATSKGEVLVVGIDDLHQSAVYGDDEHYVSAADAREGSKKVDWNRHFDGERPELLRIMLAHNPDSVYLPGLDPDVVLAGHTHGGQVFLLDWLAPYFHRFLYPFLPGGSFVTRAGRFELNNRSLFVSRGIECSTLPLRLLRVPEATVIEILNR